MSYLRFSSLLAVVVLTVVACTSKSAQAELVYGVTESNTLVSWDSADSTNLLSGGAISGLQQNERIIGIDFRPATGELYALGSFNQLYTLNTASNAVSPVGPSFGIAIDGSAHGFDFNPVIDRIRVDTDTNKNYVLNPNDGGITQVTDLFYGPGDVNEGEDPNVVHAAYSNSFAGTTSTQLYGIDVGLDILVTQANSAGTLGTVGALGADVTPSGGFDISGQSGIAYAAVEDTVLSRSTFWTVNLTTGLAVGGSEVGGGNIITALAVAPSIDPNNNVPEPTTALLAGLALAAVGCVRRRS